MSKFKTKLLASERSARIINGRKRAQARRKAKKLAIKTIIASSLIVGSLVYLSNTYLPIPTAHDRAANSITSTALAEPLYQPSTTFIGSRTITMYTSRPEETDSTPCIGSSGQDQCVLFKKGQNLCASNEFPLGTVLSVESLGECIVADRMNSRYTTNVDWYAGYDDDCLDGYDTYDVCPNLKRAITFGSPSLDVSIKH